MKKLVAVLATLCLLSVAGNAAADFYTGATPSLGLSLWNNVAGVEMGYDLGAIGADLDLTATQAPLANVNLSALGDLSEVTVGLYTTTSSPNYTNYFGITLNTAPGASFANTASFGNNCNSIFYSGYLNGDSPVTISTTAPKSASYLYKETGSYAGFVKTIGYMPTLENLAADGFVDIYLYRYDADAANRVSVLNAGSDPTTDYTAIIRIASNGAVTLNPVPLPGALALVCTGLLGMLGINRKRA